MKENWKIDFVGDPFVEFHAKLKRVKKALATWSKAAFGYVFKEVATLEDQVIAKEAQIEVFPTAKNSAELSRVNAELRKYYLYEEFWKQKLGMTWFGEGDRNTKFFHSYVNSRRRKLNIS